MVKRYDVSVNPTPDYGYGVGMGMRERHDGNWMRYSDYAALQAALKEALDGWGYKATDMSNHLPLNSLRITERIAELRKLLEDK